MHKKRQRVKMSSHKKVFRNTASKTHPTNVNKVIMRGGMRF